MRVLPNRTIRSRDDWRAILTARAETRRTASFRCRECGFVAFRALEHCPVCGRRNCRSIRSPRTGCHACAARLSRGRRASRALRNAAFQQPRASTAPILSILTLVLLVGGYVVVDRTCKADPPVAVRMIRARWRAMPPRTHRTTPCCRSCPHPSIRFIRLTERRRRSPGRPARRRPPAHRGTDGSRASGAGHARPDRPHPGATVRLAAGKAITVPRIATYPPPREHAHRTCPTPRQQYAANRTALSRPLSAQARSSIHFSKPPVTKPRLRRDSRMTFNGSFARAGASRISRIAFRPAA